MSTPPKHAAGDLRVGVSACLLGEPVRFDSGHKRHSFLVDTLGQFVDFVAVCPEVELGLGVPRETIRLERDAEGGVHLVAPRSGTDHTAAMESLARARCDALGGADLDGFVLKKDSPSCGLFRVKEYGPKGIPAKTGRGLFAARLADAYPLLPLEEEGRLNDPALRENFIERLFAYRRLKTLFAERWSIGELVAFHSAEKLNLMAHDPAGYRALGRLVADAKGRAPDALKDAYSSAFMAVLGRMATVRKHTDVLRHMAGHFKKHLDTADKAELHGVIADYHAGLVPLVVPVTLIRHYVRRLDNAYLQGQTYLDPHPKELMLRNHA